MKRREIIFLSVSWANCRVLTGFRVESDFENFKGVLILGPDYVASEQVDACGLDVRR